LLFFPTQLDQLKIEVAGVKDKAKKDDILAKIRNYRDKISQSKQKAMFGGSKPMSGAEISQVCTPIHRCLHMFLLFFSLLWLYSTFWSLRS
jgi:hypothetical protein